LTIECANSVKVGSKTKLETFAFVIGWPVQRPIAPVDPSGIFAFHFGAERGLVSVMADASWTICVLGGAGFLGQRICDLLGGELVEFKVKEVRVFDLHCEGFDRTHFEHPGSPALRMITGSVCNESDLQSALEGVDIVVHSASLVDFMGQRDDLVMQVNVGGTLNVIKACKDQGVQILVYTSSLDAIARYGDNKGVESNVSYPRTVAEHCGGTYGYSKAQAEKLVLELGNEANAKIRTCALRPRAVYGENDPYVFTNFIKVASSGMFVVKIGDGTAVADHIYVGNAAYAHICALNSLVDKDRSLLVNGKPFNLSHEQPVSMFEKAKPYMNAFNFEISSRSLNSTVMKWIATFVSVFLSYIPKSIRPAVLLTPASVDAIVHEKTFGDPRALESLGFTPLFSQEEAQARTLDWLVNKWPDRPLPKEPSRMSRPYLVLVLLPLVAILYSYHINYFN